MSRGIPCIRQMEDADCGAACLAMVLGSFGKHVDLRELRDMTGANRDGVTALSIVNAARAYRLRARGVKADIDELRHVPRGSILHWEFNHFVVFERTTLPGVSRPRTRNSRASRRKIASGLVVGAAGRLTSFRDGPAACTGRATGTAGAAAELAAACSAGRSRCGPG